jgi:hypothetical protein
MSITDDTRMSAWDARITIRQHQSDGDFDGALTVVRKYQGNEPALTEGQLQVIADSVRDCARKLGQLDHPGYTALIVELTPAT